MFAQQVTTPYDSQSVNPHRGKLRIVIQPKPMYSWSPGYKQVMKYLDDQIKLAGKLIGAGMEDNF